MPTDFIDTLSDLYSHCGDDWRAAAGGAGALAGLWLSRGLWRGLRRLLAPRPPGALAQGLLDFLGRDDVGWDCEQSCSDVLVLRAGSVLLRASGRCLYQVVVNAHDVLAQLDRREQRLVRAAIEVRAGKVLARERERAAHAALVALAGVPRAAGLPVKPLTPEVHWQGAAVHPVVDSAGQWFFPPEQKKPSSGMP